VLMMEQETADQSSPSIQNLSPQTDFDADVYRQEMTALVYERSMERMFSD